MEVLGVFDSGLGGYNIVESLRENTTLDIVFLADHKNLPYGNKSSEDLKEILKFNMQWFYDRGIRHVLIACNTASNYIEYLREKFKDMTIDSIIEITSQQFSEEDLIIFSTLVTSQSKKYDKLLNKENIYHPLVKLASLVEDNDDYETEKYLKNELSKYKNENNNYLLACTHYSIVKEMFEKYLDGNIYDSINAVNEYYANEKGSSKLEVYSSGNIKVLSDQLKLMFNETSISVNPYSDNYKVVVVSDNHGLYEPLLNVIEKHKDASVFIHCGDVELNDPILNKFYVVNGNNDYRAPYDDNILLSVNDSKIYITHSHEYMPHNRLENLYEEAKVLNANIVCFGHEHVFQAHRIDDVLIVNPGSLYYNRDRSNPSYMLLKVDNKFDIKVYRMEGQ